MTEKKIQGKNDEMWKLPFDRDFGEMWFLPALHLIFEQLCCAFDVT